MIVVYADESGTHDPEGKQPGSRYPIIAGFAARKSVWDKFCVTWTAVLRKYDVPFFHGWELREAREAIIHGKKESKELLKNPYYTRKWDIKKIEAFRRALTNVAVAGGKIPIAGAIDLAQYNKLKDDLPQKDPYKYCIAAFFSVYYAETRLQWGNFKSEVSFFFDQTANKEWRDAIHEVFDICQLKDPRMSGPNFGDKKKLEFLPLQAADLLAYRIRQLAECYGKDTLEFDEVDKILLKNLIKSHAIKYPQDAAAIRQAMKNIKNR
jgi:Protein of unknown function (DUF3800)